MSSSTVRPKKVSHSMFDSNYRKCGSIFKIHSPGYSWENSLCIHHKDFHLTCNTLLHYLVKLENSKMLLTLTAPQQTVNCQVQCENLVTFLDFQLSQGSVATYFKWGGNLCGVYIENFPTKEFWKSIHICQSYYQTSSGLLFWDTVYRKIKK